MKRIALLLGLLLAAECAAHTDRPDPDPRQEEILDVSGSCRHGFIVQKGDWLIITYPETGWVGEGRLVGRRAYIEWRCEGLIARFGVVNTIRGMYDVFEGGEISGFTNWWDNIEIEGYLRYDQIR